MMQRAKKSPEGLLFQSGIAIGILFLLKGATVRFLKKTYIQGGFLTERRGKPHLPNGYRLKFLLLPKEYYKHSDNRGRR